MAFKSLADAVYERLSSIDQVLRRIEQGTGKAELHQLALHLVDALKLFQRNPGMEAAADDLYAAATALVAEHWESCRPTARVRRLLQEAHLRFCGRLGAAVERIGPYEHLMVPDSSTRQAA